MATPAPRYTVLGIIKGYRSAGPNQVMPVTTITIQIPSRYQGDVVIDGHDIDPVAAKAALEAEYERLMALFRAGS